MQASASPAAPTLVPRSSGRLSPAVRLLLWDYARGSFAYDIALLVIVLLVFLVPGGFWGDPLWAR